MVLAGIKLPARRRAPGGERRPSPSGHYLANVSISLAPTAGRCVTTNTPAHSLASGRRASWRGGGQGDCSRRTIHCRAAELFLHPQLTRTTKATSRETVSDFSQFTPAWGGGLVIRTSYSGALAPHLLPLLPRPSPPSLPSPSLYYIPRRLHDPPTLAGNHKPPTTSTAASYPSRN